MSSHYKIYKSTKGGYYSFKTKNEITYRCFFARNSLSNDILGLTLQSTVYSFSLVQKGETVQKSYDPLIGKTVSEILNRFFLKNPQSIIGYICENGDAKALKRQLSFENWFQKYNIGVRKALIKVDLVNIVHAGAILLAENNEKDIIQQHFTWQLKEIQNADKSGSVQIVE